LTMDKYAKAVVAAAAAVNATFSLLRPCLSAPLLPLGVDNDDVWNLIAPTTTFTAIVRYGLRRCFCSM